MSSSGRRVRAIRKGENLDNPQEASPESEAGVSSEASDAPQEASEEANDPNEVLTAEEAEDRSQHSENRPRFEVSAENAQEAFEKVKDQAQYWIDRGRYSKVRIKRNGKQLGPDIPVAALLALEAATFFGAGILRGALFHAVGRVFFEVELINEAEEHHAEGVSLFLAGDLGGARQCFEKAIAIDSRYAPAHLQMGVLCKVEGDAAQAKICFETAQALDPEGDTGVEAGQHLEKMETP